MSNQDTLCVPIATASIIDVINFLREHRGTVNISDFYELAGEYLLKNIVAKPDDLLRLIEPADAEIAGGYMWKSVFLPDGTDLRMKYKNEWYYAAVQGNDVVRDGKIVSPSQFANEVTNSNRNAWRDIYLKRPSDRTWVLADAIRQQVNLEAPLASGANRGG